jgi:hypothetical protein
MKKTVLAIVALLALVAAGYGWTAWRDMDGSAQQSASDDAPVQRQAASLPGNDASDAQAQPRGLLYIVYDSSNSMWGELSDGSRKYEAGRVALDALLGSALDRERLAFRAYGHRRPGDCADTELIVAPTDPSAAGKKIGEAVNAMRPTGKTPITASLRAGLKDIGEQEGDILLISDGIETCDIDPCALMEEWQEKNVPIRVHVVGVGLNDIERKAMSCVATTSGGSYFDAGSEAELVEALNKASSVVEAAPAAAEPDQAYVLELNGRDETGRQFVIQGDLLKDGKSVQTVSSIGRNPVEIPGGYVVKAGVLLQDGSIYKPVTAKVIIDKPGKPAVLDLKVVRPAIVSASFAEDGEAHRGALVTAYRNGKKAFSFRPFDEALARPGNYEFRSNPNQDNVLRVPAGLVEGEHKIVDFDLQKTVKFHIEFRGPGGERVRKNSSLSRGGKKIYFVHARNGGRAVPGSYDLNMDDRKTPLPKPVKVDIKSEG